MKKIIVQKLHETEEREHVKILLAVESGSRALRLMYKSNPTLFELVKISIEIKHNTSRLDSVQFPLKLLYLLSGREQL